MSNLIVIATIKAKPGKEKEAEQMLLGLLKPTHAEEGCVRYALHRSEKDPSSFIFVEKWRSHEDLDAHLRSSHIAAALAKQAELLTRLDISSFVPIPGGEPAKGSV